MQIEARILNSQGTHEAVLTSGGKTQSLDILSGANGYGSGVNGGALLFLALATCYCNDVYREAAKSGMVIDSVEVTVDGEFGAEGESAKHVTYDARVVADADEAEIRELMERVDGLAEIQNTVRAATPVVLNRVDAVSRSQQERSA